MFCLNLPSLSILFNVPSEIFKNAFTPALFVKSYFGLNRPFNSIISFCIISICLAILGNSPKTLKSTVIALLILLLLFSYIVLNHFKVTRRDLLYKSIKVCFTYFLFVFDGFLID